MAKVSIEQKDAVGIIRLTHGVTNPIGPELVEELSAAVRSARSEFRGLVLAGGPKFFSIGFDLPNLLKLNRKGVSDFYHGFGELMLELTTLPIPTASAIAGHAVAGGMILMLSTDYRFAASGRTLLGLNEIKLGVPVPYMADLLLRQIVGDRFATELIYRGDLLEAASVETTGLIDKIAPKDEVEQRAVETVAELASLHPASFAAIKESRVEEVRDRYNKNGWARDESFIDIWFDPASQEGLKEAAKTF
jgi:enoyl-CoA hydratase/carnithine racemase